MARIYQVENNEATGKARDLLEGVQKALGVTPNMMKTMANSPAVLEGYLGLNTALGSTLNAKLREQIALITAETNGCGYCASAHTALGKLAGLTDEQTIAARQGVGGDPRADAALKFAKTVLEKRGKVSDDDIEAVKAVGFTDANIAEIVAHVALNVFTNYFNEVAKTEIDFPKVEIPLQAAAAA